MKLDIVMEKVEKFPTIVEYYEMDSKSELCNLEKSLIESLKEKGEI
jgi:hypothetical protein